MLATAVTAAALLIGHSVQGRPIKAVHQGDPQAPRTVLVVGSIHGNETAGHAVIRRLRRMTPPDGTQLYTIRSVNPDGVHRNTRQNADGVDLNRNFSYRWRHDLDPTYASGSAPASEPETRAVQRFVNRIRPDVTIWFHQHMNLVDQSPGADTRLIRTYAKRTGMRVATLPRYHGTATSWENHDFPGTSAFVVELPAGALPASTARRHARAVLSTTATAAQARPPIEWSPIPFGAKRKRQMRAYARRHYGLDDFHLTDPRTIVEHFTASTTYSSAFNTFAANQPDVELHELPGVCAHFIVDRDGTIHQLVRLNLMCRHTIGLNDSAIGVEHVGMSDAQVMGDPRQRRASLRLTRWLQATYGIPTKYVIGHAESLQSPFHHERVKALRNRTHGDFSHTTMQRYRKLL